MSFDLGRGSGDVALIVSDGTTLTVGGPLRIMAGLVSNDVERQTLSDDVKYGGSATLEVTSASSVVVAGTPHPPTTSRPKRICLRAVDGCGCGDTDNGLVRRVGACRQRLNLWWQRA
jgi:hypothetical protein